MRFPVPLVGGGLGSSRTGVGYTVALNKGTEVATASWNKCLNREGRLESPPVQLMVRCRVCHTDGGFSPLNSRATTANHDCNHTEGSSPLSPTGLAAKSLMFIVSAAVWGQAYLWSVWELLRRRLRFPDNHCFCHQHVGVLLLGLLYRHGEGLQWAYSVNIRTTFLFLSLLTWCWSTSSSPVIIILFSIRVSE